MSDFIDSFRARVIFSCELARKTKENRLENSDESCLFLAPIFSLNNMWRGDDEFMELDIVSDETKCELRRIRRSLDV